MRILSLASLVLIFASFARGQEPSVRDRFAGIKEYDFYWVYSSSSPISWNDGPIKRERSAYDQKQTGRVRVVGGGSSRDQRFYEGVGPAPASFFKATSESTQFYSKRRQDSGAGVPRARARLQINLDKGVYDLEVQSGDFDVTAGGTDTYYDGSKNWGPSTAPYKLHLPFPLPISEGGTPLPKKGVVLTGKVTWPEAISHMQKRDADFDVAKWSRRHPAQGILRWVIIPADEPDAQLIVEPEEYDSWVPEAGKDESTAGNKIKVKATLLAKSGGPSERKAVTISFSLLESSAEPGIALNRPLKDAKTTPDLGFVQADHSGWVISDEGQHAMAIGPTDSATATLSSFDFGAYGTLFVTAELDNGRTVVGQLKGLGGDQIRFPKRDPESRIADSWKAMFGFTGKDESDDDKQVKNDNLGDGLTAYEEYRGLFVKGEHSRKGQLIDPLTKNVFVENHLAAKAKPGFKLFDQGAGMKIIELEPGELPETRQVNLNFASAHGGDQFGQRLKNGPLTKNMGENQPAAKIGKTPKDSVQVIIDLDSAAKNYEAQAAVLKGAGLQMPYSADEEIANTIAHELAHGVRTAHHGVETTYRGIRDITKRRPDWKAYNTDGTPLLPKDDQDKVALDGSIGRPGNESSGDVGCIMAYTAAYNWAAVGREGGPYRYFKLGLYPIGKHFCTSPKATGYNLPHKIGDQEVPGFFGDATSVGPGLPAGNCIGQMKVRDW